MLAWKPGVPCAGLCPEILVALDIATTVFDEIGKDCIVTSARNGKHSAVFSRHYAGMAVDIRTRILSLQEVGSIHSKLTEKLGSDYTVILEPTHLHIQYKPRYHE